jgi:hypothetical protein
MESIQRIPRPKSSTLLSIKYRQSNEAKDLSNLISTIILHYTSNGFTYLTKNLNMPELSHYTKLNEDQLMTGLIESSNTFTKLLSPQSADEVTKHLRVIFAEALGWAFRDHHRYENLATSLEGHLSYSSGKPNVAVVHPYIKALELGIKGQGTLQSLLALLMPKGPATQIAIFNATGPSKADLPDNEKPMTRLEAMELIEPTANSLITNDDHLAHLQLEHGISDTPEVRATFEDEKGPILAQNAIVEALNMRLIDDIDAQ